MKIIFTHPILRALSAMPCLHDAYLVGGAVRDIVMSKKPVDRCEISDIDIAVPDNAEAICREIAKAMKDTAFVLDSERDVWRAMLPDGLHVDVSSMKGGGILADLAARDFTIAAMALPLRGLGRQKKSRSRFDVIDPFEGLKDIQIRLVRALSKNALSDDPLRMLRAFRLANQLGFKIEDETLHHIREIAVFIEKISQERIRDEIYIMLETKDSWKAFCAMAEAGILEHILPETKQMRALPQGEAHKYDLLVHSLKAMEYAEEVMRDAGKYLGTWSAEVSSYLWQRIDGNLAIAGLIKLAALLHDSGKPPAMFMDSGRIKFTGHDIKGAEINGMAAERLKMSSKAKELLSLTARHHMRPLHMSKQGITSHAMYRYCRDMGPHLPASLVIALADAFATREKPESIATDIEGVVMKVAGYYYGEFLREEEAPLLSGRDLIDELRLKPGPMFSMLLEDVREKRAEGVINTRDEALEYVKKML